mgnify:CR=1 FL=1
MRPEPVRPEDYPAARGLVRSHAEAVVRRMEAVAILEELKRRGWGVGKVAAFVRERAVFWHILLVNWPVQPPVKYQRSPLEGDEEWIPVKEYAHRYGVSKQAVYSAAESGRLPSKKDESGRRVVDASFRLGGAEGYDEE